ncbi:MAG: type IV pilus secretin PilQ [Nannocystaceae bacterium]
MPLPPDRSPAMSPKTPTTHSILQRLAAPLALLVATSVPTPSEAATVAVAMTLPPGLTAPGLPLWVAPSSRSGPADGSERDRNRIDGLSVEELDDGTTVLRVQGTRKPTFNVYRLSDPERLVVDIAGSEPGKVVPHVPLDTWACGRVTVDGVAERDAALTRLVVELKREASYIVLPKGPELVVTVTPREIAPEAYFARRSAQERRADIERSSRDAKALEAEARVLSSEAQRKSKEADRKVAEATERAESARAAEERARAAEQRATQAEERARSAVDDATSGKLRLRRELRRAEQATQQAEADRKAAQAERKQADSRLGQARARLEAERARLAKARGEVEAERTELMRERGRVQADAAAAKSELAKARDKTARAEQDAARVLEAARRELEQAQSAARSTKTRAQAELAKAEKDAARAAAAAKAADAAAKKKLDAAAAQAAAQLLEAKSEASRAAAEAERTLGEAERAQQRAKLLLIEARAKAAHEIDTKLAAAQAVQTQAEHEAARKLAAAEKAETDAHRKADALLASAQAEAKAKVDAAAAAATREAKAKLAEAEAEAERRLAAAKRKAERSAKAERKQAVEQAQRELDQLRAQARKDIAAQVAAAKQQAQREAQGDLSAARARAASIEEAARATLAEAESKLAQADADVQAKKKSVAALEQQARGALSRAENALAQAEAERKAAASARSQADETLAQTETQVRRAKRKGRLTAELERSLTEAKRAKAQAEGRLAAAHKDLGKLRKDRDALQRTLAQQRTASRALASKIEARKGELDRLEREVAQARGELSRAGGSATRQEVEHAEAEAARAKAAQAELSAELLQLRTAANKADAKAQAAERRLDELQRSGARRATVAQAQAKAQAAQQDAKEAQTRLSGARTRLREVDAQVRDRQDELTELTEQRDALASEGAALRERNASARAQLQAKEAKLARLEQSLASERNKLDEAKDEVARAQEALEARVAATARHGQGHEPDDRAQSATPSRPRAASPDPAVVTTVRDVRFEDDARESRVIVELDGPVRFEGKSLTPDIQVLALEGVRIEPRLERSLDASAYAGPVERITSFSEDGGAKVLVATKGGSTPRLEQADGRLVWHFPHGTTTAASAPEATSLSGSKVGGYAAATPPIAATTTAATAMAPAPNTARSLSTTGDTRSAQPSRTARWRGERIDIELQDAPIKDVLLLFSDIGRVNIIAGRDVEGSVTMKLTAVPWDQALDIILRSLSLGMVREGNVIRVATSEALDSERRQAIEQANARVQLRPLQTRLLPVSYATVDEMIPKVQSVLSPRGTVTPDSRTNTLIIMDVADNIALAEQLVTSLDTQTPQVLIEARIVEARTSFQRQLGIQWGFDFSASPGTGNPTGLLFPNSVGLAGGATGVPVDSRGLVLPGAAANPNYVVDLPAPVGTGAGGALGFSFGSISGNLNTNLRLSQAEETGEVRIISAPKIVTLDNNEAQIEQGVQIPISQVSAQGVNTRFVNATLSLRVTPHVTSEGAVLLDVQVQKNEADFINTGARGDPTILTNQAQSRMLINDSDTAVIGGIYTRTKAVNFTKVPWLADIPIVGWFFKNKSEADTRSELLIFMTPRIVNRASSIGG